MGLQADDKSIEGSAEVERLKDAFISKFERKFENGISGGHFVTLENRRACDKDKSAFWKGSWKNLRVGIRPTRKIKQVASKGC